ncbi:MAG TPA: AI-2E family transporter, partial [Terriglobia bacterium]|nr:AI-2E family transporter [Terriglobia bacterium]
MKNLFGPYTTKVIGVVLLLATVVLAVLTVRILIVPLVIAFFVSYLFDPAVSALEGQGVGRGRAFTLLFALSMTVILALLVFAPSWLIPEPMTPSRQDFAESVAAQSLLIEQWVVKKAPLLGSLHLADAVTRRYVDMAKTFFEQLPSLITAISINLLLVPFIAFFLVRDGGKLKRRVIELVPNRYFEMSLIVWHKIDDQIGGYLRGRLIECMFVGMIQMVAMGVASFFVPQPQILVISIVCGVTSLIPYVGPAFGAAFGVFLYLGSGAPLASSGVFLATVVLTHLVDNFSIAPTVLSNNVDLHPLTVVLVLITGGELMGVLGLLIAI